MTEFAGERPARPGSKAEYRSAVRSRERIRRALAELMHEQGTTRIKVKDLVARADVNRSTFYAHYPDVSAVVAEIELEIIQKLYTLLDAAGPGNSLPFLTQFGLELERNRAFYRLLIESGGSLAFIQGLKAVVLERMVAHPQAASIRRPREFLAGLNLVVGGAIGLYCDWVTGQVDLPMPQLAALISDLLENGLGPYR